MVTKPAWTVYPVHPNNYSKGRGDISLEAVVWHLAEGPMTAMRAWFNDPRAQASTMFGIAKSGQIDAYVPLGDTAYAHGIVEVAYSTARKLIQDNWGINPNLWAGSIEFEGTSQDVRDGTVPTDAQRATAIHLTAWLFQDVLYDPAAGGRPTPSRDTILMHRDISPRSRVCPTWNEVVQNTMINGVIAALAPAPPPPPPPPDQTPSLEEVKYGLIQKVVKGEWIPLRDDIIKIAGPAGATHAANRRRAS